VQPESAHISVWSGRLKVPDPTGLQPLVHCLLEYRHDPQDHLRQGWKPEGPRPEGAWFTTARPSPRKTKGRNQNFSENCSTPEGIQKSLPSTKVQEQMTTLYLTMLRGNLGGNLTYISRTAKGYTPFLARW
jgi:hypothetical protein